jgi:8-oxo-dGTP diphosphatase
VDETLDDAARRELREETGVADLYLEQLYTFGNPGRDPRGRTVSVAYYALVDLFTHQVQAATDARHAAWFPVDETPPLAFDHEDILALAHARLRTKVRYQPIGFELLPAKFTLTQLQRLYESILGTSLDKRNFRKKLQGTGLLEALDEVETDVHHRAARLHRFDVAAYRRLAEQGFNFEL